LKRWKRSREFSAIFARHRNLHDNYRIFQGPICKKLETAPMVPDGCNFSNSRRFRAWESARSGANERGRREDSIPYLTYHGDAS
jgi:hypothetical protein